MNFFDIKNSQRRAEVFALEYLKPAIQHVFKDYSLLEVKCMHDDSGRTQITFLFKTYSLDNMLECVQEQVFSSALDHFVNRAVVITPEFESGPHLEKVPGEDSVSFRKVKRSFVIHTSHLLALFGKPAEEFKLELFLSMIDELDERAAKAISVMS